MMHNAYLRQDQLAEWLGVSPRLVRYWKTRRVVPYIQVGRTILYDPTKVREALEKFEHKPEVER